MSNIFDKRELILKADLFALDAAQFAYNIFPYCTEISDRDTIYQDSSSLAQNIEAVFF